MNLNNEEYAILWDFISSDKDLTFPEKILYSIILSLSMKEGHCWATNLQLMGKMGMGETNDHRFKEHLRGLKDKNWIKIEGGTRNRKILPLKNPIRCQNDPQSNLVKKEIRGQNRKVLGVKVTPNPPLPLYKDQIKETKVKHIEAWGKPTPSEILPYKKLDPMMKGPPPTPGPEEMVQETKEALKSAIQIGSQKYLISEEDWPYFYGFSPRTFINAADKLNLLSKSGTMIRNPVAWLFAACARIKNE